MTQDEIIEIAQECGLIGMRPHLDGIYSEALEAFAKLVDAKATAREREACLAKADTALLGAERALRDRVIKAIRARGEQA